MDVVMSPVLTAHLLSLCTRQIGIQMEGTAVQPGAPSLALLAPSHHTHLTTRTAILTASQSHLTRPRVKTWRFLQHPATQVLMLGGLSPALRSWL